MPTDPKSPLVVLAPKVKARKFLVVLPIIEAKLKEGVRHQEIIRALREQGLDLSRNTYFSYLRRFRGKRPAAVAVQYAVPSEKESGHGASRRPPTFDYDPGGIPDLLK
jgi:hypothetical protein